MRLFRRIVTAFALFAVAAPLWGYVVLLKDGTKIVTREKYRRDGDKVVLVLPSGTETFIEASEVDFEGTDQLNTDDLGQARLIEEQADARTVEEQPAPYRPESLREIAGRTSLSLPRAREADEEQAAELPLTPAGFVDLQRVERKPLADEEVTGEIGQFLTSQGAEGFKLFQGTGEGHVMLVMTASSEAAVFKSLRDAAAALAQAQNRLPSRIAVLELLLVSERGQRAGQFALTGEIARELDSGAVDPATFFYRYVQF